MLFQHGEQIVAVVTWHGDARIRYPIAIGKPAVFAHVGKGYDIACLLVAAALVGDPYLDASYVDPRRYERNARGKLVVVVVEMLCQEEVPVGIVLVGIHGKIRSLGASFGVHAFRF